MTKRELSAKLKALEPLSDHQKKSIVCAITGHSRIIQICFGQVTCARCDDVIGDTLMSSFNTADFVISGHKCDVCKANIKTLTWKDRYLVDKIHYAL